MSIIHRITAADETLKNVAKAIRPIAAKYGFIADIQGKANKNDYVVEIGIVARAGQYKDMWVMDPKWKANRPTALYLKNTQGFWKECMAYLSGNFYVEVWGNYPKSPRQFTEYKGPQQIPNDKMNGSAGWVVRLAKTV